jgi:hypothetical protein
VEGRDAVDVLSHLVPAPLPAKPHGHAAIEVGGVRVRIVAESRGGAPGFDLRVPRVHSGPVAAAFRRANIADGPRELLEASRIEAGIPRWGAELSGDVLPNEALLERDAISYTKGCYMGQETVARIRTYGHVNRLLVRLALSADAGVSRGDVVHAGETAVGTVTSAAHDSGAALAFVRREQAVEGTALRVGGHAAIVHPLA